MTNITTKSRAWILWELIRAMPRDAGVVEIDVVLREAFKAGFEAGVDAIDAFGEQSTLEEDAWRNWSSSKK